MVTSKYYFFTILKLLKIPYLSVFQNCSNQILGIFRGYHTAVYSKEYYKAKLQKLNLCDDFLFREVMKNPEICSMVLEEILGIKIKRIEYIENQKDIKNIVYSSKGIRLDVYADDDNGSVFNIEMQSENKDDLAKRARYYQSNLDVHLLKVGEEYSSLKKSYVIFICCFDCFKQNYYKYTFENICIENKKLSLNDGTCKIFLNTKGSVGDVSDDLKNFLKYTENSTDKFAESCNSRLVKVINESVKTIKKSNEMGVNYMFEEMYRNELLNEGRIEGKAEGKEDVAVEMIKEGWEHSVINRLTKVSFERIKTLAEACNA